MLSTASSSTAWEWTQASLQAWLRLSLTPGVGHAAARKLLTRFGSPEAVFEQSVSDLQDCVSLAQAAQLRHEPEGLQATLDTTWRWLQQPAAGLAHVLLALGDPRYPQALLQTADPPILLYAVGPGRWLSNGSGLQLWQRSLSIVGSRNPTPQGTDNARQFAKHLAEHGWTIVSGMALGIDAAAHEGAMAGAQGDFPATIAVVGTGVDRVYPRQHKQLAQSIMEQGIIVSEFALGTSPVATNFPKRNRIISALSRGTLVVEAALASGSLITARTASEQGREVFAIPGSIHAPQSRGCHALIRQGAKLVEQAQDIWEEFPDSPLPLPRRAPAMAVTPADPEAQAHPLLQAMGFDPVSVDSLVNRTGWSTSELHAQLLELELEGWLSRLPGGLYQRTAQS